MKNFYPLCFLISIAIHFFGIAVNAQCNAGFQYSAISNTNFHFTSLQALQNGYTYHHNWQVDNNSVATTPTTDYYFVSPGNYTVCHSISIQDSLGSIICADNHCVTIQITNTPPCFPNNTVILHTQPSTLDFTFSSTLADYTNVIIHWDFGDGTFADNLPVPSHHYTNYGSYGIYLTLTDTVRQCSSVFYTSVFADTLTPGCNLWPWFSYTQPLLSSASVNFSSVALGNNDTEVWDFGDGTTSTLPVSSHLFPDYGMYNVCHTVTDTIANCSLYDCMEVFVDSCTTGGIAFLGAYSGSSPLDIFLYVSSVYYTASPVSLYWDYGDGTSDTVYSFEHQYPALGEYYACLTTTMPGCNAETQCDTVVVECTLVADYAYVTIAPNTIQYAALTQNDSLKYEWTFGDNSLGSQTNPVHVYAQAGDYDVCLIVTDTVAGCTDTLCVNLNVSDQVDTVCGFVFADTNMNGVKDSSESVIAGANVLCNPSGITFTTDSTGHYTGLVPFTSGNNTIELSLLFAGLSSFTVPFSSSSNDYTFTFTQPNIGQCGFDFGILTDYVQISGVVFADINKNGIQDGWFEAGIPNRQVHIGNQIAVTGSDGLYIAPTPMGSYDVWLDSAGVYSGIPIAPATHHVNAFNSPYFYGGNNFGIQIDSGYTDAAVDLIPLLAVTTSFHTRYLLQATNQGPEQITTLSTINNDTALSFYETDWPTIQTDSTTYITCQADVGGFQQQSFVVHYETSPSVTLGQNIYHTATSGILGGVDMNVANNTDNVHQIIVLPYDPNHKEADECGDGPQGLIAPDQKLKFVIQFENLGTYYAVNVVITDVLDENFDLSTFRMVGASHTCVPHIYGDTLCFRFPQIMLPFTQPESMGWVAFEVSPKQNLAPGTPLQNTAAIYFDQNEPVITNTTLHTIEGPDAVVDILSDDWLLAMPNPFSKTTTVLFKSPEVGQFDYHLFDMLGNIVMKGEFESNVPLAIPRNSLAAGAYFFVASNKAGFTKRITLVAE